MPDRSSASHPEELICYGLLVAVGIIPVVVALVQHGVFGVEATLGLMMVVLGVAGAIAYAWRIRRDRTA